jgi:hypothetical protein
MKLNVRRSLISDSSAPTAVRALRTANVDATKANRPGDDVSGIHPDLLFRPSISRDRQLELHAQQLDRLLTESNQQKTCSRRTVEPVPPIVGLPPPRIHCLIDLPFAL